MFYVENVFSWFAFLITKPHLFSSLLSFFFLLSFVFSTQFSILHEVGLRQTFRNETVLNSYLAQKMKQSKYIRFLCSNRRFSEIAHKFTHHAKDIRKCVGIFVRVRFQWDTQNMLTSYIEISRISSSFFFGFIVEIEKNKGIFEATFFLSMLNGVRSLVAAITSCVLTSIQLYMRISSNIVCIFWQCRSLALSHPFKVLRFWQISAFLSLHQMYFLLFPYRCCCGQSRQTHPTIPGIEPGSPGDLWLPNKHTRPHATDAYGTIEFQGGAHPTKAQVNYQ